MISNKKTIYDIGTKILCGASVSRKPIKIGRWKMLRHDSESSRRLLYSGIVKTWFKAILGNQKIPSWFCRLLFFSKIAAGGPTKTMKLMLSFLKQISKISKSKLFTLLTPKIMFLFLFLFVFCHFVFVGLPLAGLNF